MKDKRLRNWREIVKTLKVGPDLGIHGTKVENSYAMVLQNREGHTVTGHFFFIGKKEKELEDALFYGRLCASVDQAIWCSRPNYSSDGKNIRFEREPCVILGIDSDKKHLVDTGAHRNPMSSYILWIAQERSGLTFDVGHDFLPFPYVRLESRVIPRSELKVMCKDAVEFADRRGPYGNTLNAATYLQRRLTESMIRKIYRVVKSDRQSQAQPSSQQL